MEVTSSKKEANSILVVDDDKSIRQMLTMVLGSQNFYVLVAKDGLEALEILKEQTADLIISDVMMPNMDGYELCQNVKSDPALKDIYIILLTAKNGIEDRVIGLDQGADDYLGKPFATSELIARVRAAFRLVEMQRELKVKNQLLQEATRKDSLTQVYNRHHFNEVLAQEVTRCNRYGNNLALIIFDIDFFKSINDTYGHLTGDEVIKAVANSLKNNTRENDTVARYGGEEFTVVLPETGMEGVLMVAEKLRRYIETMPLAFDGISHKITISGGVASYLENGCIGGSDFIDKADQSLLIAKRTGRNRIVGYPIKEGTE